MSKKILLGSLFVLGVMLLFVYALGRGWLTPSQHAEVSQGDRVAQSLIGSRLDAQSGAANEIGVASPNQILFGDLHVHTTFSFDAFQMSLPMAGGDGAYPVADACDYARHCAGLDFWSINDHAVTLTPRRWEETVDAIRQCNAVAGDPNNPDVVAYLGWEWTQVGSTPENHYGHKNVIVRDLAEGEIPSRPISAGTPPGMRGADALAPSPFVLGALALYEWNGGGPDFVRYLVETGSVPDCPVGVPVRDLPTNCREIAPTPKDLFEKLDDWNFETLVIPHGTAWGMYTPPGSSWTKQIAPGQHDPSRQRLIEVYSGHGNSEEFRPFGAVEIAASGARTCPEPTADYLPSCWRAGEIITERCLAAGENESTCAERAEKARQGFIDADFNGGRYVIRRDSVADWEDSGQCRDCFLPAFNYRPQSSVQAIMALGRPKASGTPERFRFGFIGASDNHSGRPGTGYKPVSRTEFTETRFGNFVKTPIAYVDDSGPFDVPRDPLAIGDIEVPFAVFETERAASFFLEGGLAAVHAPHRDRDSIFQAMQRREVYGTSGPRILLWFDLLNPPGGRSLPMGSEVEMGEAPIFQVRAVGSFEQKPGCPPDARQALSDARLERLCRGECYHPSDQRRPISRIEVVRVRPQKDSGEAMAPLIEDPWKVLPCSGDPSGCQVAFSDPDHAIGARDALYYVRAIEAATPTVGANPLHCEWDASGRCASIDPCFGRPPDDECLADAEHRAWSSPIFVDYPRG
ncbi:MAG: DUF3604 domain-containing protein [Myxococcota bacterium]|nr:DUF3604 domain-containing protein [Myxococcota bacterium]